MLKRNGSVDRSEGKKKVRVEGKTEQSNAHAIVLIADALVVLRAYRGCTTGSRLLVSAGPAAGPVESGVPHDTDRYYGQRLAPGKSAAGQWEARTAEAPRPAV